MLVNQVEFMGCPRVTPHYRHQRYLSNDRSHEAGYDAYVTGTILIRMLALIAKHELPPPPTSLPDEKHRSIKQNNMKKSNKVEKKLNEKVDREQLTEGKNAVLVPHGERLASNVTSAASAVSAASDTVPSSLTRPLGPSKKVSYAHVVQGSSSSANGTSTNPSRMQQLGSEQVQVEARSDENIEEKEEADDGWEDESIDEDYNQHHVQDVHVRPFSIQSPSFKDYQNILYWGRSNHGSIYLCNT
ncbi:hypothetical protein BX616_006374 [Lobosporangium transversale]|nr:hypothetical protein BX616_006374 [Lobosporangium transversale]